MGALEASSFLAGFDQLMMPSVSWVHLSCRITTLAAVGPQTLDTGLAMGSSTLRLPEDQQISGHPALTKPGTYNIYDTPQLSTRSTPDVYLCIRITPDVYQNCPRSTSGSPLMCNTITLETHWYPLARAWEQPGMHIRISQPGHQNQPGFTSESHGMPIRLSRDVHQNIPECMSESTWMYIRIPWHVHQNVLACVSESHSMHRIHQHGHQNHPGMFIKSLWMQIRITMDEHQNHPDAQHNPR